ncbi:MAG: hypothetical protein K2Y27_19855 [Xanthobacteraceae bacterium]|nr:hypothetical protein [Xanthobacteraceae bacterium]
MIIHLDIWLDELRFLKGQFATGCAQNDDTAIERSLYYSAFIIRKISETPFVTRNFMSPCIDVAKFKPQRGSINARNWLRPQSHFDLRQSEPGQASLVDICNALIHSRFLTWRSRNGEVDQIIVSGGVRAGHEGAIGFRPAQYAKLLTHVETYGFKRRPVPATGRSA